MSGCSVPSSPGTVLRTQGHVVHVLEGQAPDPSAWVELGPFKAGFEAGSTRDIESIGEFVSFNGVGYARSTGQADSGEMITGLRLLTNGAVFLPAHEKPAFVLEIEEDIELAALVDSLVARAGGPVCYTGVVEFRPLRATAITRAPIYGDYIFDAMEDYYVNPPTESPTVHAAVMGCAANLERCDVPGLDAVLYANPAEPTGGITSHTHALELTGPLHSTDEIKEEDGVQVYHVFSRSVVSHGRLEVYRIGEIRPL